MRYARAVASSSPVARTRSSTSCVIAASVGAPSHLGVVARSVALASGTGQAEVCVAGGGEFCSDQPIRYSRLVRQMLMKAPRARTAEAMQEVGLMMRGFSPASLVPELVDPREFSTNEVMGESADRLCEVWAVSRREQDQFGLRSHTLAEDSSHGVSV